MIDGDIKKIQKEFTSGQYVAFAITFVAVCYTIYAMNLSVQVNKRHLQKLKDEGY